MKDNLPKLASLDFPSDRLTLGALRRRFPDLFDQPSNDDSLSECPFLTDDRGAASECATGSTPCWTPSGK